MARPSLLKTVGRVRGIELWWRVIRELNEAGPWAAADVAVRVDSDRATVTAYVAELIKAGYAESVGRRPVANVNDARLLRLSRWPNAAPRFDAQGRELAEPIIETLWRSMKMLKTFTAAELVEASTSRDDGGASLSYVRSYMTALRKADVVQRIGREGAGNAHRYRIARNIGARAPKILFDRSLYDPNTGCELPEKPRGFPPASFPNIV